jgi:hypothetical protein
LRFYKGPQNTGTHSGRIWSRNGVQLATVTFRNETSSGWQQANFSTPVQVEANTTYVVSYRAPRGKYSGDNWYFSAGPIQNGPLVALQNGQDGGNGVYRYGSIGFPSSTFSASNYWVDVVFNTVPSFTSSPVPQSLEAPMVSQFAQPGLDTAANEAVLSVPDHEFVPAGEALRFIAAAEDRDGKPMRVSAVEVPKGAHFDASSGRFEWIAGKDQEGRDFRIAFQVEDRSGKGREAEVRVTVGERPPDPDGDSGSECRGDSEGRGEGVVPEGNRGCVK